MIVIGTVTTYINEVSMLGKESEYRPDPNKDLYFTGPILLVLVVIVVAGVLGWFSPGSLIYHLGK